MNETIMLAGIILVMVIYLTVLILMAFDRFRPVRIENEAAQFDDTGMDCG